MDINATGRVVHALAALAQSNGNVTQAAASKGITEAQIRSALSEGGANFYSEQADGRILPTSLGQGFADRVSIFPSVNW